MGQIPPELVGRAFMVGDDQTQEVWITGTLGGPSIQLPAGERGLDADGTRILSVTGDVGAQELIVRSYPQGQEEVRLAVTEPVEYGVLRGDVVYWSGSTFEFDNSDPDGGVGRDGGVWRVALPNGTPEALIFAGPLTSGFVARGWPVLSPSGRTMGALLCKLQSYEGGPCIAHILDLETGELRTLLEDSGLASLTDAVAIRLGFGTPLEARAFDETLLWSIPMELPPAANGIGRHNEFDLNYLTDDGSTLIQGIEEIGNMTGRYRILEIDVASGIQRVAAENPLGPDVNDINLVRELSSDRYVALRSTMSLWESLETGTPLRLLDLATGELVPGVFPLDRPQ
ncbi:MAG: hypothetical protein IT341_06445 [Chloroflexi bacterium]|nr:hypothetical protein [Chloroflexota bacterium]